MSFNLLLRLRLHSLRRTLDLQWVLSVNYRSTGSISSGPGYQTRLDFPLFFLSCPMFPKEDVVNGRERDPPNRVLSSGLGLKGRKLSPLGVTLADRRRKRRDKDFLVYLGLSTS